MKKQLLTVAALLAIANGAHAMKTFNYDQYKTYQIPTAGLNQGETFVITNIDTAKMSAAIILDAQGNPFAKNTHISAPRGNRYTKTYKVLSPAEIAQARLDIQRNPQLAVSPLGAPVAAVVKAAAAQAQAPATPAATKPAEPTITTTVTPPPVPARTAKPAAEPAATTTTAAVTPPATPVRTVSKPGWVDWAKDLVGLATHEPTPAAEPTVRPLPATPASKPAASVIPSGLDDIDAAMRDMDDEEQQAGAAAPAASAADFPAKEPMKALTAEQMKQVEDQLKQRTDALQKLKDAAKAQADVQEDELTAAQRKQRLEALQDQLKLKSDALAKRIQDRPALAQQLQGTPAAPAQRSDIQKALSGEKPAQMVARMSENPVAQAQLNHPLTKAVEAYDVAQVEAQIKAGQSKEQLLVSFNVADALKFEELTAAQEKSLDTIIKSLEAAIAAK